MSDDGLFLGFSFVCSHSFVEDVPPLEDFTPVRPKTVVQESKPIAVEVKSVAAPPAAAAAVAAPAPKQSTSTFGGFRKGFLFGGPPKSQSAAKKEEVIEVKPVEAPKPRGVLPELQQLRDAEPQITAMKGLLQPERQKGVWWFDWFCVDDADGSLCACRMVNTTAAVASDIRPYVTTRAI